ncbi:MAG: hypothetical protein GX552_15230 [Chloroflexi bacterium]|jgi:predicted aldo/keto reductase-like oxidoreductase|nr:hypothetical protein [Chloroflexota bacterium]
MEYRRLGRTGLRVSVLGIGGGYLASLERSVGERIYQRAFELGVNYFDGRYGDSSFKLRPLLKAHRDQCVIVSKTHETTADRAIQRVEEDLQEFQTDYIDVYLLRAYTHEMLQQHLGPGGSMEGLLRAREQGKVGYVGLSGHGDLSVLTAGIETGVVDVVMFPINIVRREAFDDMIPAAQKQDVGLAVMKPFSAGTIPAHIALPWLVQQPIHTIGAGVASLEHVELDVAQVNAAAGGLTPEQEIEIEQWRQKLEHETCRICDELCGPCPKGLYISGFLHHDVWYNHYLTLGLEGFLTYPWADWAKRSAAEHFRRRLARLQACDNCGLCEQRCPHHLPIMDMLEVMRENHPPLIKALEELDWAEKYKDAPSPYH